MKEVNSVSDATNTYGEDIKLTTTDASTLYLSLIHISEPTRPY